MTGNKKEQLPIVDNYELPIVLQNDMNVYLYLGFPACVFYTKDNIMPWYYENFIEINMIKFLSQKRSSLYYSGFTNNIEADFQEIFYFRSLGYYEVGNRNIIAYIKAQLKSNYYVYLFMDEYYVS